MSSSKKQKASWGEKEQARISTEDWGLYKSQFMPRIDGMVDQATDKDRGLGSELKRAAEGVHDAFEGQRPAVAESMRSMGINPNSGQFKAGLKKFDTTKASSMGTAQAQTQQAHESEYATGVQDLIATGRGIQSGAQKGISMVGNLQTQQAISEEQARLATSQAVGNAAGTAAGMGIGAYGQKKGWFDPKEKPGYEGPLSPDYSYDAPNHLNKILK